MSHCSALELYIIKFDRKAPSLNACFIFSRVKVAIAAPHVCADVDGCFGSSLPLPVYLRNESTPVHFAAANERTTEPVSF